MARMGHESVKTTVDTYGHLLPELDDDVLYAVSASLRTSEPRADIGSF